MKSDKKMSAPIFVVGLPRSGSTLLSRILNESSELFSINDLYFVQAVLAKNVENEILSKNDALELVEVLFAVVIRRSQDNRKFIGQFNVSVDSLIKVKDNILLRHNAAPMRWFEIMNEFLMESAKLAGKTRWVDKTPQNFLHIDLLSRVFPGAQFIFLLRDPRKVMASLKFASGEGHDCRRYHPVPYALYWRAAARTYILEKKRQSSIILLRYEDIVHDLAGACLKLRSFLKTDIHHLDLLSLGNNSSFTNLKRSSLTSTEAWLCQRICFSEMSALGYQIDSARPRFRDLPELFYVTLRFISFQFCRLIFSLDGRKRILSLFKALFKL